VKWFLIFVVAIATYTDLKSRRIPNWLTYPFLISAVLVDYRTSIFVLVGVIAALLFGKYVGSGDIKLAAGIAAWSHILSWSQYWIYIALLIGGVFGLSFRKRNLPFAPFMAAGLLIANMAREFALF
jgi:Flp pilus assembly protein protease CpaA